MICGNGVELKGEETWTRMKTADGRILSMEESPAN